MDNSIYEVTRDEYAGVVGQINTKFSHVETFHEEYGTVLKIVNDEGIHYTTRIVLEDEEEHYYVFNLPEGKYCLPPKAIRKITLETKEEVQAFFDALNKLQEKKTDE